ncbi:MAG: peptide/nickel transport system substrate-binding protein [Actinomycetota bacterium]|nr:peptide/nickel transport system substrate-binding protein [Actinomycetota bacterium]
MRRQRRGIKLLALVFCFGLLAAACGSDKKSSSPNASGSSSSTGSSSGGSEQKKGGTLILGAEQWPDCINPITQCANSSWMHWAVDEHVLPRLMELDDKGNFVPSPVLDGDPKLSGAGTESGTGAFTVTYKIAADAVWDDGSPITGDDIDFTKDAYLKTTGTIGTVGYDKIDKVTSTDNGKTVAVSFTEPFADWQDLFGGNSAYLLKKAAFASTDVSQDMLDSIPFSAAPFKLQTFTKEQAIFVPNDKYWDADRKPFVDQVVFKPLADSETELNALKAGEVFAIYPQPSPGIVAQLTDPNIKFQFGAGTTYEGLWFNEKSLKNPDTVLADKTVREALLFATDRQAILDQVIHNISPDVQLLNCAGWVPTVGKWCNQDDYSDVKFDPAKVKSLLEGAGWAKGSDGIYAKAGKKASLELNSTTGNSRRQRTGEILQSQWKEAGFDLKLNYTSAGTLFGQWAPQGIMVIGLYAQVPPSTDPGLCLLFCSKNIPTTAKSSGQNWTRLKSDALDKPWLAVDTTLDEKARKVLVDEGQKAIAAEVPALPIDPFPDIFVYNKAKLHGPLGNNVVYGPFWNMNEWWCTGGAC